MLACGERFSSVIKIIDGEQGLMGILEVSETTTLLAVTTGKPPRLAEQWLSTPEKNPWFLYERTNRFLHLQFT